MMQLATGENQTDILTVFRQHKTVFPYLRVDYLNRKIAAGSVIWDGKIVIIYQLCKVNRTLGGVNGKGSVDIRKGDIMLSEMASKYPGSPDAGAVFQQFLKEFQTTIWLTVRADNKRACAFYKNHGVLPVGSIAWSKGTIPGFIYSRPCRSPLDIFSCL